MNLDALRADSRLSLEVRYFPFRERDHKLGGRPDRPEHWTAIVYRSTPRFDGPPQKVVRGMGQATTPELAVESAFLVARGLKARGDVDLVDDWEVA